MNILSQANSPPETCSSSGEDLQQGGPCARSRTKWQAILTAAQSLFWSEGYRDTNMDAVSALAKVSKATLYSYFSSKSELFSAVLEVETKRVVPPLHELRDLPVNRALLVIADRLFNLLRDPQTIGLYRVLVSHGRQCPEMVSIYNSAGPHAITKAIGEYLADQDCRGTLQVPDPNLAALLFVGMVKTQVQPCYLADIKPSPAEVSRTLSEVVRVILRAYAPLFKEI